MWNSANWPGGQKSVDSFFERGRTNAPKLVAGGGRWRFTHGTGKLGGIKGGGTYSCKPTATGAACDVEGSYTLRAK